MSITKRMLIGGQWLSAETEEVLPVFNPATGKEFSSIPRGSAQDVDKAVKAARRALDGRWGKTTATERGRLMLRAAQRILDHHRELAEIETLDTGKPVGVSMTDVAALARYFEFYGSAADKLYGHVIPYVADHTAWVLREPIGITAHIIPWNYPLQMLGRSVAPSLAMGNTTVLKPAEDASLSSLRIAELLSEVGFPEGVFNVVTGLGDEAGAALAKHPDINFISFTGSTATGEKIHHAAAANGIRCVLELGGKSPQVVFDDCNAELAAATIVRAITYNAGQTCSAGSRVLIQASFYEAFMERLVEKFSNVRVGMPAQDLDVGPVISRLQKQRVTEYVVEATHQGVPILATGSLTPGVDPGGYFVKPIMFGPMEESAKLANEEVFGPVLSVLKFHDELDAVRLANSTQYGLVAAVWTANGGRQQRMAKALRAGQVFINSYGAGTGIELPFGGVKRSGIGREKGLVALEEVSTTKTVLQFHGDNT